jgi:hypothetical protein
VTGPTGSAVTPMAPPADNVWTLRRATVLMALGLAACSLVSLAADHSHRPATPPVPATAVAETGDCGVGRPPLPSPGPHDARLDVLRLVDCRAPDAQYEVVRVVPGSDPRLCLGVPEAELGLALPPASHQPAETACVTLLDVQARGAQE